MLIATTEPWVRAFTSAANGLPAPATRLAVPTGPLVIAGVVVAALLLLAYRLRHRSALSCPVCGSRLCARVGQVGAYRNGYRCHTCGFLWEPDSGAFPRPASKPRPAPDRPA